MEQISEDRKLERRPRWVMNELLARHQHLCGSISPSGWIGTSIHPVERWTVRSLDLAWSLAWRPLCMIEVGPIPGENSANLGSQPLIDQANGNTKSDIRSWRLVGPRITGRRSISRTDFMQSSHRDSAN